MKAIFHVRATARRPDAMRRPLAVTAATLLASAILAACGGGGGGSGAPTTPSESPSGAPGASDGGNTGAGTGTGTQIQVAPFVSGADSFLFSVDSSLAAQGALEHTLGGATVFGAWNPSNPTAMNQPGVKVSFFGQARGCDAGAVNGAVAEAGANDVSPALSQMGIVSTAAARSWTPTGAAQGCSAAQQASTGPAMVALTPDATHGGFGLRTVAGGTSDFFGAYGSAGQNGAGANAFIAGTFVSFRAGWNGSSAVHPFAGADGVARVFSQQTLAAADVSGAAVAGSPVQVKQQVSVAFINSTCAADGITAARPCQLKYLFNTAVLRAGVSDWSTQGWFRTASVLYDPGQGGIPVLDGPVTAAGTEATEDSAGVSVYTSQGVASQHAVFADQPFDLRISFAQLQSFLRLVVAQKSGVTLSQVADADVAAMWGARWNDPSAWELLTAGVGQEVHDPFADRGSMIGGAFKNLYVGPQR